MTPDTVKALRKLFTGKTDPMMFNSVQKWTKECYHTPDITSMVLLACNELMGGHGVESIEGEWINSYYQSIQASYVNMGDTYTTTVIRDNKKAKWLISTVGDLIESSPRRFGG